MEKRIIFPKMWIRSAHLEPVPFKNILSKYFICPDPFPVCFAPDELTVIFNTRRHISNENVPTGKRKQQIFAFQKKLKNDQKLHLEI